MSNKDKALLKKVKANLILQHNEDDALLLGHIAAAVNYAENYQHKPDGFYSNVTLHPKAPAGAGREMTPTTEQAVIMLSCHFYESRDGSTGGFFMDNAGASQQVWNTVNMLLRLNREVKL